MMKNPENEDDAMRCAPGSGKLGCIPHDHACHGSAEERKDRSMHIFLFGGTTEGRRIAETLAKINAETSRPHIQVEVYVVSSYGASLLPKAPGLRVHVGRLDEEAMTALFTETISPLVIDATHPYAVEVSENILKACAVTGVRCIRVEREDAGIAARAQEELHWVSSIEEAAERLGTMPEGNILITTGSKELAPYTRIPNFSARCYVRALPTMEALEKCQQLGFRRDHLILMQGPFSEEMNLAQLRYAGARYLVTKASGEAGGFPEKCEAALALGVTVIVIGRTKEVSIPHAPWYDRKKVDELIQVLEMEAGHENR